MLKNKKLEYIDYFLKTIKELPNLSEWEQKELAVLISRFCTNIIKGN